MPIFEYNGKKYNVRDEHIDSFMKDFPDASTIMEREGKKYRVKSADYKTFMSEQQQPEQPAPDSTPETPATPTAGETPLTEQDKIRFNANIGQMKRRTEQMMDGFNEQMETMREYHDNAPLGGGQTAEGKMKFNPKSGKLEKTYITPLGNRYTNKGLADMESFRYRQAADMSVGGQLRRARLKLAELQEKRSKRASEVLDETTEFNKTKLTGLGRALIGGQMYVGMQQGDKENSALDVAIRQTEELIKDLEEQNDREQGVDVGFWRGFGRVAGDVRTWDFGMSDMRDALTMMNADDLKGENATEGEREAYNEMMGALYNKGQAEQMYGGNADFWNRAGMMAGHMPAFMLDFGITGGGFKGINVLSKAGTKAATKVVGKEAVEKMAEQGFKTYVKNNGVKGLGQYAANWTIKALGTTADDLLLRTPLMTNTVQAGKTTADIIDRKLGDVVVDENGNYDFSNDKTWGNAIWQGEANAIVENATEMGGNVLTLDRLSKFAGVFGAKRISEVLAKANAGTLGGMLGKTNEMFQKVGVGDYLGEVGEEYKGQLWRTMLNLDDAYQQNPDGTRTNLLATGQFHGDIWGGMALSMGLMGAGKATLSGAQYASMKHGVNKADARATELLGKEIWEPLRATIDLTINDDIGSVAEGIVNDKDFSDDERAAVLTYMERSLMMRGFNLGTLAQKRGGEQDEDVQSMDESYIDGYNLADPREMTDAKNMRDYQRQRVSAVVDEETLGFLDAHPMNALEEMRSNGLWGESELETVLDYLNAKQVYDGMIQRVRDDIDARVEQSNAMVDARTNRTTGMIQGATMKQDDRRVYVVGGNLVQYADGSGIDNKASDDSIIVRDAETGALEQVSPDAVLNIDEPLDPLDEKMTAAEAIRQQTAQEASDKIDGVVTFNPGDTYTITGDDAQVQVQIVPNEDGIVDNGDGTVNVSDGVNIFPLAKETIQQQADAANLARVAQFEQQRTIENAERKQEIQEADRPQYALNDIISLTDENGVTVRGNITSDADADGRYEVFTEAPINGKRVNLFTRDELDNMLLEHNGVAFERPAENEGNNGMENIPENSNNAPQNIVSADLAIPAMQRIPKDEQGNPLYEQTDSDTAWDAIVEQTEGDEVMAGEIAADLVAEQDKALKAAEKELKKVQEGKPVQKKGDAPLTMEERISAKKASKKQLEQAKANVDAAKERLAAWQRIASTPLRRKQEAEAERRRMADEAAALRKAEEEKRRAEREEAERIEREALNGVPDMVDDKPQDARARGYRRMNGHKIDRQEPVQALQGKDVSVKFSDDVLVGGHAAVIDANRLQPSHIQGVRNPLHFIDEAQPKERNDEASLLSSRKIAGNIRPEEITSSVTAYTGAPTVNARGEVIQGNNRSDALRQMWEYYPGQADIYKQYLKDHAEQFGLQAEDIEGMEHPVLVNMVDVDDAEAINLGQFVAQDTESGGIERIKPKNIMQKMGNDMRSFANLLLASSDEEISFAGLVDANGTNVLKWMMQKGYITPTQYSSAFDSKGNLTAEAKNDLRGIMYQSIFKGGSVRLEEMFNALPVKAQKAILATAFRDYDSPNAERMVEEIQNSIRAYYALSQDRLFAEAKNFKEARIAVESWKRQYQIDDATGESYLPADNFSNFALLLATMYKGSSQGFMQGMFAEIYDLVQGTQEATLFEEPDNTPRTLTEAINEAVNKRNELLYGNEKFEYDGQRRSNVLAGGGAQGQREQQGSRGDAQAGERVEDGTGTAERGRGTERNGGQRTASETHSVPQKKEINILDPQTMSDEEKLRRGDMLRNAPAIDVKKDIIKSTPELSARKAAEEWWDAHVGEPALYDTEVGEVEINKNSIESSLAHRYGQKKLDAITSLVDGFENAVYLGTLPDSRERGVVDHYFAFPINYNGERHYVFCRAMQDANKNRLYVHEVFVADKIKKGDTLQTAASKPHGGISLYRDILANVLDVPVTTSSENSQELSDSKGTNNSVTSSELGEKIAAAEAETNTNPTDKQKEAGNYKKGHVQVGTFDITIEQPKGSVRSGVDAGGNKWETTMQNTYGYIRGTEGVDGDHIDVFLSDDIDGWNGRRVFVVDQYNEDGSFDEHKVMLGFNEADEAEAAYFANYDSDWAKKHKTVVTAVNLEDFEKWIDSSHRKTKAFAEYKSVKSTDGQNTPQNDKTTGRIKGEYVSPNELSDAYKSGDKASIASAEQLMRAFISANSDEPKIIYVTYLKSKNIERENKDDETKKRTFRFIADACKDALLKAGLPAEAMMSERTRTEFARKATDPHVLDVMSSDISRKVIDAIIKNPNTADDTLETFVKTADMGRDYDAQRVLDDRREKSGNLRKQKADGEQQAVSPADAALRDALADRLRSTGIEVVTDSEAGQRVLDEANGNGAQIRLQARLSSLDKAAKAIHNWIARKAQGKVFTIELPEATRRMIRNVMGRDFDSHNITINGIRHGLDNHGVDGKKLNENSIPVREEDAELIPYIMTAPDYVRKGSEDVTGRESVRFYKTLSNGYVVVVEKEYKNSPDDMETITMWAEMSSEAINAQRRAVPDTHVQNAILSTDAAKILKDAENAIRNEAKLRDHVRFFRTADGEAYGFTAGDKIYLDPKIATAETPVHEYAHLWSDALRRVNPEEWQNVVELMKDTPVWEEVKSLYPELETDSEIADEVLAHYSGRRGAERLREAQRKIADEKGDVFDKARAISAIEQVKEALKRFWKGVADWLHIHFTTAEEVADKVMADLLNGVNPMAVDAARIDKKELIAVHNLSEKKLKDALELGGFPMPSIAITKADVGHTNFGVISLVFDKESINPSDRRNKVYGEDAWTPTFPKVGYKLNDKKTNDIYDRANKAGKMPIFNPVDFHPTNFERHIDGINTQSIVDHFKDDYGAKQLFLSEKGDAVKEFVQKEVQKYNEDDIALYKKILAEIGIERLRNESAERLADDIARIVGEHRNIDFDKLKPNVRRVKISNARRSAIDYAENGNTKIENDIDATKRLIDERVNEKAFEQWLDDLFDGVVVKKGIRNDKDWYTPSGSSRNWEALYDEITLDNVVRAMQKQSARGGEGLFGGSIFGAAQEEYKDIDAIREAAKNRIRTMDEAEYDAKRNAITDRLSAVNIQGAGDNFSEVMDMCQNIQDAVARSHTPKGIHKYLKAFYPKVTMENAKEIADIVKDIQRMSARYFEAKPYRAVGFDEVKLAVVPSDTDANLVERLKQMGIEVKTYAKGDHAQRREIVDEATEKMRLRFQLVGEKGAANMDKAEEATVRLDNLSVAREMEKSDKDAKSIKLATGWERGADGKWRYEIMDGEFDRLGELHPERRKLNADEQKELNDAFDELMDAFEKGSLAYKGEIDEHTDMADIYEAGGMERKKAERLAYLENKESELEHRPKHLDDYLSNEELFLAYPQLRNIEVKEGEPNAGLFGNMGSFNPETNSIKLNLAAKDVLLHEVQHAIQHIEGFATGGNPSGIRQAKSNNRTVRRLMEKLLENLGIDEWLSSIKDNMLQQIEKHNVSGREFTTGYMFADSMDEINGNALRKKLDEANRVIFENNKIIGGEHNELTPEQHYHRLSGEVEARNAEKRMDMTEDERRNTLASETEDVAREDQIFIMNSMGGNLREGELAPGQEVSVVETSLEHGFKDFSDAKEWAKSNIARTYTSEETGGKGTQGGSGKLAGMTEDEMQRYIDRSGKSDDVLYRNDEVKDSIEDLFNRAASGELKGKPVPIGSLTEEGKKYLERISGIPFRERVDFVLNPSDMVHIYKNHFGNNEKDKGQNMPLNIEDIRSIADIISTPDKIVFFKEGEGNDRNMFYFFKEDENGTYNLMEIYSDRKGNLTAKTFYKTKKGSDQRVIDLERSLLLTSKTSLVHPLSDAKIPQMFENPSVSDENLRVGDGALTDDDLSMANDPVSKSVGKSTRTARQRRAFAERERLHMVVRVRELAEKLHLDNVDIVTDASTLQGDRAKAKGFFSRSTGRITVVIPNQRSVSDAEQTLLHEAVAHYGLRQLFGDHFDRFLDNVFNNAEESIRRRIMDIRKQLYRQYAQNAIKGVTSVFEQAEIIAHLPKNESDFTHTATEEYLASLAENTEFENINASWWREIKELFLRMLHKIGFEGFSGVTLSDNELRYILWRSYENLAEPGRYRSILGEAADVAKQAELKVGNYTSKPSPTDSEVAEAGELEEVNERFNEELSGLTEENADKVVLSLGRPSAVLLSAGVSDKPMKLYGNKVVKKMKKHGFALDELQDLPRAVANPIAVFNNYGTDENRSILTEMTIADKNILVSITVGKGNDVDFNIVSSVFGKGKSNIIDWINKGYATYIDKKKTLDYLHFSGSSIPEASNNREEEKALDYLHHSALLAEALSNSRLSHAAKVIKEFENPVISNENISEDDALYRDGDPERHERELARDRYEQRVKSGMYQSQEALQDSMLGLKEAMTAILGKRTYIEDVDGFENAYLGENRLSSVNKAEADAFAHLLFKPMLDEVAKLARTEAEREELTDYMMAKHGLERNTYMRNEAIHNGATDAGQTDYAGLTALTGMDNVADAEAEAQLMVNDYEQAHDTAALWKKVNAVSKAILSKSYECGMMSKATFDKVSGMYDFYIPLRGFDEKTSSEAYAYLTHKQSAFNAPIKKAEGRRSKADDPFANLQSMAEGAIMQGNRNKLVKQRFLNFALNHPSDLVSVSELWLEYDNVADEWKPVFPDNIDSTDTPEEVERKMQDFETKMESLAQQYPDRYKHGKDTVNIPYRIVESRDLRQHQIVVKRGGRDYVITINGNPRAAQAVNGQTNPDNDMSGAIGAILRAGENINRQLSAFYTTRNPDFIVSNFIRDMLYTNTMVWIKESPNYALRFHRNYMYANPVRIKQLLAKHRKGMLDMSDKTEAMFHQFMMNGGETGYANIRDIEQHKNDIRRELKKSNGKIPVKKAWDLLGERFDEYNRAVENCARFAAFMTSREMGRSIDRAIYDAKEISVNFNKKGSGAKFYDSTGQTKAGNASALVSGLGRSGYVFWNAAIQGTTNFGRQMKRHPAKAFTGIAAMFLLGAIVACLGGDDDDEDDKNSYYNLPEHVRRSNILFRAGDSWVSIPLPVEYRAFYGMGELMVSVLNGKEHLTGGEIAEAIAGQATQILPIDFLEGGGGLNAFVPSAYKPLWEAYVAEKSWTGMPLYKDTPWNKDMPEWTKAYKSANKYIVGLANAMNEATGGDPYTKGAIDFNPAKVEYMLNGYFGGVFGTIDKLSKTAETIAGDREYDPRSLLLVNRLVKAGDERTEYRAVNNEYFRLKEEHDRLKSRLKHYEEDTDNGIFDYAEKIDFLYNSPEYERYEIFEDYHEDIDDLYNELKEAISDEERKDIEAELNEVKKEMIDEINLTRKRK